jgi:hypothetical protein
LNFFVFENLPNMQPIDSSFSRGIAAAAFAYGRADRLSGGRVRKRGAVTSAPVIRSRSIRGRGVV